MNSITMNFDDGYDINAVYNQLKKQYPKIKITKNNKSLDEMLEDEYLFAIAKERINNKKPTIPHDEMLKRLGISREELDNAEADEFE